MRKEQMSILRELSLTTRRSDLFRLSSYVRQSMNASRRVQPIPPDFEHAFGRVNISLDSLRPLLKTSISDVPTPILLPPSPPPEDELIRKIPFLNTLREEEKTEARPYIPKHFPDLPSKHTYSSTPILTERDNDPRKIRERAAEDGRHGEEALRKLAAAAFRGDNVGTSSGKEKKLWGRRMESMETMFEKTVKGLAKKIQKDQKDPLGPAPAGSVLSSAMEIDSHHADADAKSKAKHTWNMEMGPIVNCERDYWRRPATGPRVKEEKTGKPSTSTAPVDTLGA